MKTGDRVLVTYADRTVEATILLASQNGKSLMVAWEDGMLGGHCGTMAVLQDERGQYRSLFEGRPVTISEGAASIACPKCGRRSYHLKDIEHRYCAVCGFHADLRPEGGPL